MIARTYTVAFEGMDARLVEVQTSLAAGLPSFAIVGLPDKAVSEARERVRAALSHLSIALPSKRIVVNLSPADLPKEGSHFDLPIALSVLAAIGAIPAEESDRLISLGELSLDGKLIPVNGALPAAVTAGENNLALVCPREVGPEAAWVDSVAVFAAPSLLAVLQHFNGHRLMETAKPGELSPPAVTRDFADVKGQERAKRALEIAAAGRHNVLMIGPPGSGKSMLAARLPGILPPMSPAEALETSMIQSLCGLLKDGGISRHRPFREPHQTASMAAIIGGGRGAKPGEISLAHNGVLFLDELPEFPRAVLDTLRQPIETGEVIVSRANAHVRYPSRFMLVAAANPCKCGELGDASRACNRAPVCGDDYLGRISGPLLDRFDIRIDVPAVRLGDIESSKDGMTTDQMAARVGIAHRIQAERFRLDDRLRTNADLEGDRLDTACNLSPEVRLLITQASERFGLSARGYHRVLRLARTIADLDASETVRRNHAAEALTFRLGQQKTLAAA